MNKYSLNDALYETIENFFKMRLLSNEVVKELKSRWGSPFIKKDDVYDFFELKGRASSWADLLVGQVFIRGDLSDRFKLFETEFFWLMRL